MARMSRETFIRQKIAEPTQQITHFEQCIEKAREHQVTLQQPKKEIDGNVLPWLQHINKGAVVD